MKEMMIMSLLFILLFIVAEFLYRVYDVRTERTRKVVHVGTGLLSLLFPLLLDKTLQVFTLCLTFAVLLIFSQYTRLLPSINNIKRLSFGSLTFPLAVVILYYFYKQLELNSSLHLNPLLFYYAPLLTMTIADPVAAMTGRRYPIRKFKIGSGTKSLGGWMAGFITAFVVNIFLFTLLQLSFPVSFLWLALGIAIVSSLTEFISPFGLDNITIPLSVLGILYLYENNYVHFNF